MITITTVLRGSGFHCKGCGKYQDRIAELTLGGKYVGTTKIELCPDCLAELAEKAAAATREAST